MRITASWVRGAFFLFVSIAAIAGLRAQSDGSPRWAAPFTTLSTSTVGNILSSPAVAVDGTIYFGIEVGAATSSTPSGRLFALNPNGSKKWTEITVPDWVDSTPAIGVDGTIYFGCWDGNLYAYRPDGTRRWAFKAGSFIASSPAIGPDGTLYVGAGSNLVAVTSEGGLKWSFPAGNWIDASPAVGPDGTIYVGSWDENFYAIRPDGTERWRFTTDGGISSSAALAADGTIYFGSRDLTLYALSPTGALKWSFGTNDTIEASPVLAVDGTVYVPTTGGRLFAISRDGAERWRYPRAEQAALNGIYSTPAVRSDGSIVFGSANNALYALRADGTLLWQRALGDISDSSPVVASDGAIYIGCADKKLYAFNGTAPALATDWPQFRREPTRTGWQLLGATPGTSGRLINLAVRTFAGSGDNTLFVGFVAGGSRSLLVRGVGPTLSQFQVDGRLANPRIAVTTQSGTLIDSNDDWGLAPNANAIETTAVAVGAFPLPRGSADAALLRDFVASPYSVQVAGDGGATGVALMEVYDATTNKNARLTNVSARSVVQTGAGILIGGFVIGDSPRTVLVRGIGPSLTIFQLSGVLADPQLRVFRGEQLLAENNDWSTSSNAAALAASAANVGAFRLEPGTRDAVMLLTLPPGPFSAQVSGVNGGTGIGLVEIYEVP